MSPRVILTLTLSVSISASMLACSGKDGEDGSTGAVDDTAPTTDSTDSDGTDDTSGTDDSGTTGGVDTEAPAEGLLRFEGGPPTNVLMISVDTTRKDYFSPYDPLGSDFTPFLAARMGEGVVLGDHRSCSNWTYSSVLCVITGQDNLDMGWVPSRGFAGVGDPPGAVPDGITTLANHLSDAGYRTSLVSTNSFLGGASYNQATFYDTIRLLTDAPPAEQVSVTALEALDEVREGGEPWMLHVHYFDPHNPYDPPEAYRDGLDALPPIDYDLDNVGSSTELYNEYTTLPQAELDLIARHIRVLYGGEVSYFDDQMAALWGQLEAAGALDDTLVVFWTDHGEQFFEHGAFTHGQTLNVEETASAAFFWASNLEAGVWDGPTTHEDLAPTIMAAMGYAPGPDMTGARIGDDAEPEERFALSYAAGLVRQSLDIGGKRLLYSWTGELEYYDFEADPTEANDLFTVGDPDIQAHWDRLLPEVERMKALFPDESNTPPEL